MLLQKEELEQKHVHLLQVVESEKTAKWQYTQQCEDLSTEIKKLRNEVILSTTKHLFNQFNQLNEVYEQIASSLIFVME